MAENFLFLKWSYCVIYVLVSVCIIFLILTYHKLIRRQRSDFSFRRGTQMVRRNLTVDEELQYRSGRQSVGLASSVIHSLPAVQFKESIKQGCNNDCNTDCAVCLTEFEERDWLRLLPNCAVCLTEFEERDWLRLLPNCAHVFHVSCVDIWFRTHSTCPLCRTNVLYDFSSPGSSASGVALLASLRREDPCQERPFGHRLLDTLTMQNPEYRLRAVTRIESDSEESLPAVSPLMGGTNNRITVENLVKLAHSYKGESSNTNRNASPEIQLQVRR